MKILVSDPISEKGIQMLKDTPGFTVDVKIKQPPEELKKIIGNYDAILVRSETQLTADVLEHAKSMKIIGRAGVGVDNVNIDKATQMGIIVMNTPGGNTISTCEHTMSMIMALSRNIAQANASMKEGKWDRKKFMGVELLGKTIGIIGLGRIGTELAKRANAFGMKILAYDPFITPQKAAQLNAETADLDRIFRESDYITVHTPKTEETKGIINDETIAKMKKGVRIINCARGGIVDEEALIRGIESGKVAGAAIDVYMEEPPKNTKLVQMEKIVTTPHLGASTEEAQENVAVDIAKQVIDALKKGVIVNAVNMSSMDEKTVKELLPYIVLGEKLGAFTAQIVKSPLKGIEILYAGETLSFESAPVTNGILKGFLAQVLNQNVNAVNARFLAEGRGIAITEVKSTEELEFTNYIEVRAKLEDGSCIKAGGSLFRNRNDSRIVKINECFVDAIPQGYLLIVSNSDVPGIIGKLGTILGNGGINIADMTLGRDKVGGTAMTILNVDTKVPDDVMKKIKASKDILDVKQVRL